MTIDLGSFWEACDATLARIRTERPPTADALIDLLGGHQTASSGDAFFDSGGGDNLDSALADAGWELYHQATYLWEARSPAGDWIRYVEGDVYRGRRTAT